MSARRMLLSSMRSIRAYVGGLLAYCWRLHPRVVRRISVHCPATGEAVEIELLMKPTGAPDKVLRCSSRAECPPTCRQACRDTAEAVLAPVRTLIYCPPGSGPPEALD